jgi:hypothetical protein
MMARYRTRARDAPPNFKQCPNHPTSTRDILTTMALINDAVAAFKSQDPKEKLSL